MTCHDVSCYQSNPDHLWTTKDDAFRDVISACERCGESNEAPKFLFLRFFCFFHLRLHQSQVCCLLFVDLFLYMFDHFYFLRLVVFVFLFKPFVGSGLAFVQPAAKLFSSPREWHLCSSNPSVWRGRENHRTCSHSHTVFTCFYSWTWENLISADKALWPVFLFSTHQIDGFQFPDFFSVRLFRKDLRSHNFLLTTSERSWWQ